MNFKLFGVNRLNVLAMFKPPFRSFVFLLAFVLTACANIPQSSATKTSSQIVVTNVTAIDAINGVRENVDILIDGEKIAAVGKGLEVLASAGATRIDGTDKYAIPGLWDAHVHLAYHPDINHEVFFPLSLAHGITYLRDTGGHLDKLKEARELAANNALTPDLYVSGPLVDGEKRVYAGQSAGTPDLSLGVGGPDQAIEQIDQLAAQGVDFIKAYEMLSPETLEAVIDQAAFHKLPVTGHPPLAVTARQAMEAGMKDIQHLRNLEMACTSDPAKLLAARRALIAVDNSEYGGKLRSSLHRLQRGPALKDQDEVVCNDLIAFMKKKGVSQTPTLVVSRFLSRQLYAEKRWQDTFALMPKSVADNWEKGITRFADRKPTESDIAYDKWLLSMVKRLSKSGVSILAGTDAPIGYLTPGLSLHEELAMLVEAGLTPLEAIKAATIAPAAFLGLENSQGSIAPSMKADLVLLTANPLENIRNTTTVEAVVKNGLHLNRDMLDKLKSEQHNH